MEWLVILLSVLHWVVWLCASVSLLTFAVPQLVQAYLFKEQDLKKKYGASWAVVTGGSSGIGRAITEKLAKQGINVVIVALADDLLVNFHKKIQGEYPKLEFRAVGVDLGGDNYLGPIMEATKDIDVSLLFNNAGFIMIGFFADLPIERQMKNYDVNATSSIRITHHFLNEMIAKKLKGIITFTSSPAGLMPYPFSTMYGATKAFLTEFGSSLAAEVKHEGIDVLVLHPSPVDTNFYNADTAHKSASLGFFRKTATAPTTIADVLFSSVGRWVVVREQGYFSVCLRLLLKLVDINFLAAIIALTSHTASEYKKLMDDRKKGK